MRRLPPLVLTSALLLTGAFAAQKQRPRRPASASAPTAKPGSSILVEHDAEEGTSTVRLEPMPLEQDAAAKSQLLLMGSFKQGAGAGKVEYVNLTLLSRSPKCRFPPDAGLQFLLDGAPLDLKFQADSSKSVWTSSTTITVYVPKAEGVLWVQSQIEDSGECAESLAASVSPRTLARLAASKSATMKTGATTFKLTANALAALRDLAGKAVNSKQ